MESIDIKDIRQNYPDEWVLLGNPTWDNYHLEVLSGIPLYHSIDKKEVCYLGRPLTIFVIFFGLFYFPPKFVNGCLPRQLPLCSRRLVVRAFPS